MPTTAKPTRPRKPKAPAKAALTSKRRAPAPAPPAAPGSKQSQLIALLRAPRGTSIEAMTTTTGWQPHTVRGTISGVLRKRLGLNVVCTSEAGKRIYRIVDAA